MELTRGKFQGLLNVVTFNWHLFIISFVSVVVLLFVQSLVDSSIISFSLRMIAYLIIITTLVSLVVTHYIYDHSNLYSFSWLSPNDASSILNINAGFDEVSYTIKYQTPSSEYVVADFYDEEKHTELSIKRARERYPSIPGTLKINTNRLPFENNHFDLIIGMLSIHEIRENEECIQFLKELKRILKPSGQIVIIEHLRDLPNILAYNIGAWHFHSKPRWLNQFESAGLTLYQEEKITAFISKFTLTYGNSG